MDASSSWIRSFDETTTGFKDLSSATSSPYEVTGSFSSAVDKKDIKIQNLQSQVSKLENLLERETNLHQKTSSQLRNISKRLTLFLKTAALVMDAEEFEKHVEKISIAEQNQIQFQQLLENEIDFLEMEKIEF